MATPPPPSSPSPAPTPSSSGKPSTGWWAGAVAVALVLMVGGYLFGHSQGVSSTEDEYAQGQPKYEEIFNAGAQAGTNVGETAGKQQGQKEGLAQGVSAGKKVGFENGEAAGKQAGLAQGQAEGREAGATAALGFSTWDTGQPYIIRVEESDTQNVPYTVSTRTQMVPGKAYALCSGSTTEVCVVTDSASANE